MPKSSKVQIIEIITKNGQARPQDLYKRLGITRAAVHRHLKSLVAEGILEKYGSPPQVFYRLAIQRYPLKKEVPITLDVEELLAERYLYVSPDGHLLSGEKGFREWARRTHQGNRIPLLAKEYQKTRLEADQFFLNNSWIEATKKFQQTFPQCFVNKVFYEDFYSLPKFGETKKGHLVLQGKQGQIISIIRQLAHTSEPVLRGILKKYKIEAVGWIPHSIPREIAFLKEFRKEISLPFPTFEIVKAYSGQVPVAQKSLSKLEERIANAENTLFLKNTDLSYKRVLLIDDAVGSGATLNEMAKKIKQYTKVKAVYGFAIVGSLKGFEVLREI